jgi:NADH-quinone oxidoreductase subunit L
MTFHGKPQMPKVFQGIHESPKLMTYPLILLAGLSFFLFYTLPYYNPFSDHGWFTELIKAKDSVVPGSLTAAEIYEGVHHAHYPAMILSLIVAGLGIGLSYLFYFKKNLSAKNWSKRMGFLYNLSLNKYFFDENYNRLLYQPFLKLSRAVAYLDWDLYDKYFINGFGRVTRFFSKLTGHMDYEGLDQSLVDGVGRSFQRFGEQLKHVQTGRLQNYMLFALIGVIVILVFQTI